MRVKLLLLLFLTSPAFLDVVAQDMGRVRAFIDTLAAPGMHGRGYEFQGDKIAATYIKDRFEEFGVKSFKKGYFQKFTIDINTFPGKLELKTNQGKLVPGKDYLVKPFSGSGKGSGRIQFLDSLIFSDMERLQAFLKQNYKRKVFVYNASHYQKMVENPLIINKIHESKAVVELEDRRLIMSMSSQQYSKPFFQVKKGVFDPESRRAKFKVEAELKKGYETQNVLGYIPGTVNPDSFVVVTAHYDHLGRMGKETFFPGANDNASGVSMLLELAHHYSQPENAPEYTMVFMAFSAEEVGLLGSKFYTENPLFPLKRVRFLINLDLLGTGDEGMMVVNGKVFTKEFDLLTSLNEEKELLPVIKSRGEAANSDHYFFYLKKVPCFFLYTLGGIDAYHDVFDKPETLPLTKFSEVFDLITYFIRDVKSLPID